MKRAFFCLATLALLFGGARQTKAGITVVDTNNPANWSLSTVNPIFDSSPWPGVTEAFIASTAGTYTLPALAGGAGPTSFPGAGPIAASSGISLFRTTFVLPAFSTITADVQALADNDPQIFVNGHELALYGTDLNGFGRTPFRLFDDTSGNVTNAFSGGSAFSSVTSPFSPSDWIPGGTNEIIVADRNLSGGDSGGFSFLATIDTEGGALVPEPGSLTLLGIAGIFFGGLAWRRRKLLRADS